ncbi:hypothetical protein F511_27212 [Dorcoceras hygrometricum]|uniref:Uncharacterized protein n=1 Tax=Dorcoceras hygrometricum TaxID=472368 RepID=A0A2Z7CV97_9LAMI|nr:hypothetical protein F511_27212 [Dorcoceras hygrometricum]
MRIRPPEFETGICDEKYHVSLAYHFDPFADSPGVIRRLSKDLECTKSYVRCDSGEHCYVLSMQIDSDLVIYRTTLVRTFQVSTRSVLGKCVYLVTLVMSLFDLQDVCIDIGSIATLDLPMVVDLIGIYGLKGPYCTLTTTDCFLQALSVIPRGSWGDVARRFTIIRWAAGPSLLSKRRRRRPPCATAAAVRRRRKFVSGQLDEENPFVQNSSVLLVQADEGVSVLVVDRIGDIYRSLPRRAEVIGTTVGARHKCQQGSGFETPMYVDNCYQFFVLIVSRILFYVLPLPRRGADPDPQQFELFQHDLYSLLNLYLGAQVFKNTELSQLKIRGGISIDLQSDFSKGKSGNISSNELKDCTRSVDAKISRSGQG